MGSTHEWRITGDDPERKITLGSVARCYKEVGAGDARRNIIQNRGNFLKHPASIKAESERYQEELRRQSKHGSPNFTESARHISRMYSDRYANLNGGNRYPEMRENRNGRTNHSHPSSQPNRNQQPTKPVGPTVSVKPFNIEPLELQQKDSDKPPSTYFARHLRKPEGHAASSAAMIAIDLAGNLSSKASMSEEVYNFPVSSLRYPKNYQNGEVIEVYPSYVVDPTCLFVVHDENNELDERLKRLATDMEIASSRSPKLLKVPEASMVVAVFDPVYKQWFRAVIVERLTDRKALILFLDYGDLRTVELENMMPMTAEWMKVPRMTLPVDLEVDVTSMNSENGLFSSTEIFAARKKLTNKMMKLLILYVLVEGFVGRLIEPTEIISPDDEPRTA